MTARLILSALIIIATWLDVASTLYATKHHKLYEANLLLKPLVPHPVLFYVAATVYWGGLIGLFFEAHATLEMFIVLCVVRFAVVGWNVRQISKARRKP